MIFCYHEIISRLLQAVALQIGGEVSFHELAQLLGVDTLTVRRYLDLLKKNFIIFHLPSFSRNLRNELKKSRKFYFYDNGIRNALLNNFNPPSLRPDAGALWENFIISERVKRNNNHRRRVEKYFWRTAQQQEIDYVEDADGQLAAFECKWNPARKAKLSRTFANHYPAATFATVTPENYFEFVT